MENEDPVRVGIVGFGYWGPKLFRNLRDAATTTPVAICDRQAEQRARAAGMAPDLAVVETLEELLEVEDLEAVAIATPVRTHFELARRCLEAGKHILVEKPFTYTSDEALELIQLARARGLVALVDHTFLFTSAVRKLRELTQAGELGDLLYYDSTRINLGLFQPDVDVLWDLAPHDFSILDFVVPARPRRISAIGASHAPSSHCDIAFVTLDFGDGLLGHLNLNWLAPQKVRRILIGGSRRMAVYDDVLPDEKIRIYDRGIEIAEPKLEPTISVDDLEARYQSMISYRTGDMYAPFLDRTEALLRECIALGDVIRKGAPTDADAASGLRVVLMLEAASRSLEREGRFVEVDWGKLEGLP